MSSGWTEKLPEAAQDYIAGRRLARFDTGGRTPLAAGLLAARDLVARLAAAIDTASAAIAGFLRDGPAS